MLVTSFVRTLPEVQISLSALLAPEPGGVRIRVLSAAGRAEFWHLNS